MTQTHDLAQKPISKLLLSFFIPAFIGVFINALYNIVDRIFIGNLVGADALSGVSIIFPIMLAMTAFGMLLGIGGGILISINLGRKDLTKANQVLGTSFLLIVITATIITSIGMIYKESLLRMFGATDSTLNYANEYLSYILLGTIFQLVGFSLNNIIRSEGNARIAMISMLMSAGCNILLDYILVYHLKMGVAGAAIATVVSMALLSAWVIFHFKSSRSVVSLKKKYIKLDFRLAKEIGNTGFPPFSMQLAGSIVQGLITTQLVALGGDLAVGAMGVIISISMMIIMSMVAINMASQPIFGYNYGAMNYLRVKSCLVLSMSAATVIGILSFAIVQLFPHILVDFFNNDSPELIEISKKGLQIAMASLPIIGFQIIIGNYYQSIGKSRIATILPLLRQVIVLTPLIFILPKFWGLNGVWLAMPISDAVAAIIVLFFIKKDWKRLNDLILDEKSKLALSPNPSTDF
ncbi:MAG: MATE family efflux transporter [Mangrovibacterium sp.]